MADLAQEIGESAVLVSLVWYLLAKCKEAAPSEVKPWRLLLGGLSLILCARLFEITEQFAFLDSSLAVGPIETAERLAKGVGSFGGLLVLATGLVQLLPTMRRAPTGFAACGQPGAMLGGADSGFGSRAAEPADRFQVAKAALLEYGEGHDSKVQALRQSEERYDLAMEAIREGVYDWNIETGEIYFSPRVKIVLGFSPEEFSAAKDWLDRIHPDDVERYTSTLIEHLKGKSARFQCEYRFRDKIGEWRWARHHGIAIRNGLGRASRMAGSLGDITERKLIGEKLRESRKLLHAVVNAVPAMISVKDLKSHYVMMNKFQADIYGISKHDAIGKTADELLDPVYGTYTRRLDRQVFESGEIPPLFRGALSRRLGAAPHVADYQGSPQGRAWPRKQRCFRRPRYY